MSEWSEAVAKVEAIHQGAMVLLAGCPTMMPETAVALSQKTYTLASVLVLGPLNEDAE